VAALGDPAHWPCVHKECPVGGPCKHLEEGYIPPEHLWGNRRASGRKQQRKEEEPTEEERRRGEELEAGRREGTSWRRIRFARDAFDTDPPNGRFACCGYCGFVVASARIPNHCPCEQRVPYCDQTCQARDWVRHRQVCTHRYSRAAVDAALVPLPDAAVTLVLAFIGVNVRAAV